jgi:uncharacterized protein YcaQ
VTELDIAQARALHLAAQGLLLEPAKKATPKALRECITRMQLLQIDTIHVVARSPYLVLHSRLGEYPAHWLEDALAQGHVFETWAHEACFAPTSDLHVHRTYNQATRRHWGIESAERNAANQRAHLDKLLEHVRTNGPVKSSDFERTSGSGGGWWGWKDEKRWLETLFAKGELMVARRENFHRVYDLSERVAPQLATLSAVETPSAAEVHSQFIERSVEALGITQARWIHDYFRIKPRLKDSDLDALVETGKILRVSVEGWQAPAYVHQRNKPLFKKALAGMLQPEHTCLLSPFDPVVWDRERASVLFDFDYRIECYTPEPKRVYGYFVLPILCRGELIGRLDAKAHRTDGVFEVKSLHAQSGMKWTDEQTLAVGQAIAQCAAWHKTPQVRFTVTRPVKLKAALQRWCKAEQV